MTYVSPARLPGWILGLAVFLTCGLSPMQGDTWWQLRAGHDMWAAGRVLLSDHYSHTAAGAFWSNHEWLSELIFYLLYRIGGLSLLMVFSAALITSGWLLTWRMTRGSSTPAFVLTLVALTASAGWWEPRPHAFSLLFIPLTIFLVHRGRLGWLPLVFLLWANTHGGVLLGFVLLGVALAARTAVDRSWWRSALVVQASAALAMTLTPLGAGFWIEIPRSLSRISLYTLDEWSRTSPSDPTMLPFWGIAALYLWELAQQLRRLPRIAPSEAVLHACALVMLPGAIAAVRNVGPFLMIAVPAVTHLWVSQQREVREEFHASRRQAALALTLIVVASTSVVVTLGMAYRHEWARLRWSPIPAAAVDALRECPGNLYNRYDEGGMLMWFSPGRPVFLDGRQDPYPPAMVLEHIEMENGRTPYHAAFARYRIACAFLPLESPVARQLVEDRWRVLFRDQQWIVLGARPS